MAKMGRPKGSKNNPFKSALLAELRDADGNLTKLRQIGAKLVDKALEGDMAAIKEIADRTDGKPSQAITGPEGGPLQMVDLTNLTEEQLNFLEGIFGDLAESGDDDEGDTG